MSDKDELITGTMTWSTQHPDGSGSSMSVSITVPRSLHMESPNKAFELATKTLAAGRDAYRESNHVRQ